MRQELRFLFFQIPRGSEHSVLQVKSAGDMSVDVFTDYSANLQSQRDCASPPGTPGLTEQKEGLPSGKSWL